MVLRRFLLAGMLAVLAVALVPQPAFAYNYLEGSPNPYDDGAHSYWWAKQQVGNSASDPSANFGNFIGIRGYMDWTQMAWLQHPGHGVGSIAVLQSNADFSEGGLFQGDNPGIPTRDHIYKFAFFQKGSGAGWYINAGSAYVAPVHLAADVRYDGYTSPTYGPEWRAIVGSNTWYGWQTHATGAPTAQSELEQDDGYGLTDLAPDVYLGSNTDHYNGSTYALLVGDAVGWKIWDLNLRHGVGWAFDWQPQEEYISGYPYYYFLGGRAR